MTGPDTQPPAPGPPGRDRGLHLTAEALQAAVDEDQERAAEAVRELDRLGTQTLVTAVTAWCDTLINAYRQATGTPDTAPVQPGWVHADSGVVAADADGVPGRRGGRAGSSPPAPRWTTRPVMRCWVRCRTTRPRLGSMW